MDVENTPTEEISGPVENQKPIEEKNSFILPVAILAGSLIIAGSIFYNTKVLITELKSAPTTAAGVQQNEQAQNGQAPGQQVLGETTGPVEVAERTDAAVLGNSDAPVTIVEFTDFQCPYCQRFYNDAYQQIKQNYVDTGKAKIVFRHYPLSFHINAQKAGEAAECANRQGKFLEYHDILFKNGQADGTDLNIADLKQYAKDLRLDASRFNACLDGGEASEVVNGDLAAGTAAGVSGTPSFFINGTLLVGALPYASFEQAIEAALNK